MYTRSTTLILAFFVGAILLLSGCSSSTKTPSTAAAGNSELSGEAGLIYSDGATSNTGIPGLPRASTVPLTESRPVLIDLDYLTDTNGFSTSLEPADEEHGQYFQSLGDVNGDAMADFTFSTDKKTTVVFGGSNLNDIELDNISGESGFVLDGEYHFQGVGDINNDGIDDIALRAEARIIFGTNNGDLERAMREQVLGIDSVDIYNSIYTQHVRNLRSAGDFNGDGIDDLLVGGYALSGLDLNAPNAWVIYGHAELGLNDNIDLGNLPAEKGLSLVSPYTEAQLADRGQGRSNDSSTASITGGFDFNGDGIGDIAVGNYRPDFKTKTAERRTYIVYGSRVRSTDTIDMTVLNGQDGIRIVSSPFPYDSFQSDVDPSPFPPEVSPDRLAAVGDIDANGFNDLAISHSRHGILIVFGGRNSSDAVINSSALPNGFAMHLLDSNYEPYRKVVPAKVGDIDNDGVDDLGVTLSTGDAVIIYGTVDTLPESLDLTAPMNIELTRVQGISDEPYSTMMVALGDINNDGIDDLGIGWSVRRYLRDMKQLDDINGDGIEDVSVAGHDEIANQLLRVLYGFPAEGFTGFLPATTNPKPVVLFEEDYFNEMVNALDSAAGYAIKTLNDNARLGIDSGPTAEACLSRSAGAETGEIEQFSCDDAPLSISYEWFGNFGGSGTAQFASVAYTDGALTELKYTSEPIPQRDQGPRDSSVYSVFVNYDINGVVEFSNGVTTDQPNIKPSSCTIDVATRTTQDDPYVYDPYVCINFLRSTIWKFDSVFGANRIVENLTLLP